MSEPRICTVQLLTMECKNEAIFRCSALVGDSRQKRLDVRLGCRECGWAWAMEGGAIEPIEGWESASAQMMEAQ